MSPPSDALAQLHSRCQDARKATNPRSAATLPIVQSASLPTLPSAPLLHRKRSDLSPPSSDRLSPTSRPEQQVVHGGVQHMHGLQWRGRALHPVMTHHDEKEGNAEHAHETHGLFEDISEGFVEGIESAVESVSEAVETGLEMWAEQEERSVEMADESNLPVDTVLAIDSVVVTAVVQSNSTADISYKRFNQLVVAASVSLSLAWVGTSVSSYLAANAIAATPMASLTAIPAVLWQSYQTAVAAAPVPTKAALTGVTYVFGDAVAQTVALRAQNKSAWSMDPYRYARNGVVGLVLLGPLAHYYYDFVADNFADWPIFLKIGLDQTLYLAFYNTIYYVVLGLLAGQSLEKVWSNYMSQFTQLLVAGWKLWPAVGLITYTVIPTVHRVLFVDAIEILYSAILSTLSNTPHDGGAQTETMSTESAPATPKAEPAYNYAADGKSTDLRSKDVQDCFDPIVDYAREIPINFRGAVWYSVCPGEASVYG